MRMTGAQLLLSLSLGHPSVRVTGGGVVRGWRRGSWVSGAPVGRRRRGRGVRVAGAQVSLCQGGEGWRVASAAFVMGRGRRRWGRVCGASVRRRGWPGMAGAEVTENQLLLRGWGGRGVSGTVVWRRWRGRRWRSASAHLDLRARETAGGVAGVTGDAEGEQQAEEQEERGHSERHIAGGEADTGGVCAVGGGKRREQRRGWWGRMSCVWGSGGRGELLQGRWWAERSDC